MPKPTTKTGVRKVKADTITIKGRALIHKDFHTLFCTVPDDVNYHGSKNMIIHNTRCILDTYKNKLILTDCTITYHLTKQK